MTAACPCQSGLPYADCCEPLHDGAVALSPSALMRSRYSAYVLDLTDYLLATWHPDTRPLQLAPEPGLQWRRLQVMHSESAPDTGVVHFIATWQQGEAWGALEEHARFALSDGCWRYRDGDVHHHTLTPSRNAPCPCGSGIKYKRCCRP